MPLELFVWYRSPPELGARVQSAAHQVLAATARQYGIHGRLLQRADAADTWMEHYPLAGHDATVMEAIVAGLGVWAPGLPARHGEPFALLTGPADPRS